MAKLKFDWDSQNFDLFFQKQLQGKNLDAESDLPKEILFKLLQGGGNSESYSTSKMSGLEKIYVLHRALNKKIFVIVEDEEEGIGFEQYVNIRNSLKKNPPQSRFEDNGQLHLPITFVKANKELSEIFNFYNNYLHSPAYRYSLGIKNRTPNRIAKWKKEMRYLNRLFLNYEAVKLKGATRLGLSGLAELYVLMFLYDEEEKVASALYKDKFFKVHGAGIRQSKQAFAQLSIKGLINKRGTTSNAKYNISPLGSEKMNEFFKEYAANL